MSLRLSRSLVLSPFGERLNEAGRLRRRATSVTPAEIAGRTYYPYERCARWTARLQATSRTMLGACERVFRAYRGRSTQSACVGLFEARSQAAQARTNQVSTRSPSNRSAQSTCGLLDHERRNDDIACALRRSRRQEDPPDHCALTNYVVDVVVPLARWTIDLRALEDQRRHWLTPPKWGLSRSSKLPVLAR